MFFKVLKLLGLDVPAKLAEVRTTLEEQVELAKDQVTERAQTAASMAALFGLAGLAMFAAAGVGLAALYDWVALSYGPFYGYAAVIAVLLVLAATALIRARLQAELSRRRNGRSRRGEAARTRANEGGTRRCGRGSFGRPLSTSPSSLTFP